MTIKFGRSRRYLITKNLILMLVMVVLIILAVLAWFTFTKTVSAEQITVKAISSEIDIAESLKTFDASNNIQNDGPGEFGENVIFNGPYNLSKDCTGDGTNLIVPEFNVTKDFVSVKQFGKDVNTNLNPANAHSDYSRALEKLRADNFNLQGQGMLTTKRIKELAGEDIGEYQYIEEEFYVRSKNKNLMLTGDSQLLARTEVDGYELTDTSYTKSGETYNKKSAYGNFNVDGLVGAIRVALIGQGTTTVNQNWTDNGGTHEITSTQAIFGHDGNNVSTVKQLLWLPRPDVYLNVSGGDDVSTWTLSTGVTASTADIGAEAYKNTYYKKKSGGLTGVELVDPDSDSKTKISSGSYGGHKSLGYNVDISDFSAYDEASGAPVRMSNLVKDKADISAAGLDTYYVTKYTLKIWIEGTDKEARRAMDEGSFKLSLFFL